MNEQPRPPEPRDPPAVTVATNREPVRPPPRRPGKGPGRWIGLGLIVVIIGLVASTMKPGQGAFVYSKRVDEVLAEPQRFVNTDLRIEGLVARGSIENAGGSSDYRFRIEGTHASIPVHYVGIVPDTFREGIGVTVHGRLDAQGRFEAHEVVAKCPSKYEMQAAQARGEHMPPGMGMPAAPAQ